MARGPGQRRLEICGIFGFMKPTLVIGNHGGGAHDPKAWLAFFHQHVPTGVLLTQRNLPVAANELESRDTDPGSHDQTANSFCTKS